MRFVVVPSRFCGCVELFFGGAERVEPWKDDFACHTLLAVDLVYQVFCTHVETLAKRGKKQVVPEGLYDALIAVIDLLQKMVSVLYIVVFRATIAFVLSSGSSVEPSCISPRLNARVQITQFLCKKCVLGFMWFFFFIGGNAYSTVSIAHCQSPLSTFYNCIVLCASAGLPEGHEGVSYERFLSLQARSDECETGASRRRRPGTGRQL